MVQHGVIWCFKNGGFLTLVNYNALA